MFKKKNENEERVTKVKKPIYKKPWFIAIAAIIVLYLIFGGDDTDNTSDTAEETVVETTGEVTEETTEEVVETTEETVVETEEVTVVETEAETVAETEEEVSREYRNALANAETYAELMNFSKARIFDQLTSEYGEGFPEDAAQYAIDTLEWDYKENAYQTAKTYYEDMEMSLNRVKEQLTSEAGEKFTEEEAQYAIDRLSEE